MVQRIILITILHTAAVCSSYCLTWEMYQNRLRFICRTTHFSKPIALIDSHGNMFANCSFTENGHYCTPVERNLLIGVDYSRKYIFFTIPKLDEHVNGIWTCLLAEKTLTTTVSLSKGIIAATEIHITGTSIGTTGSNAKHELNCFSCREPDGYNVEILLNGRTEDSITYNRETGQCNHRSGKCHPDECNCTANEFKRVFHFEKESKDILYTCDMLFTDAMNNAKFSIFSSVVFNGEGFSQKNSSVSLIKAGDTNLNGIFTVLYTATPREFVPTLTPQVSVSDPVKPDNNPVENKDRLHVVYLAIAVLEFIVGSLLAVCCLRFYLKSKRLIQGTTEAESLLLEELKEIPRRTSRKSTTYTYETNDGPGVSFSIGCHDCTPYQGVELQVQNRKSSGTNKIKRHFSLPLMHRDYSQI